MGEPSGTGQEGLERSRSGSVMAAPEVELWFVSEVLPLESVLTQFLRHNWRDANDIEDLRQEVYVRVCEGAQKQIPEATKPFVLTIARNLGHKVEHFTTATFDMTRHYRPTENVQRRPTKLGGQGFYLVGHHEIMVPLLFAAVTEELAR